MVAICFWSCLGFQTLSRQFSEGNENQRKNQGQNTMSNQDHQLSQRFFELSQDIDAQALMTSDSSVMNHLTSLLSNSNTEIIKNATGALKHLSKNEKNLPTLYNQTNMTSMLTTLTGSDDRTIKKHAVSILNRLNKYALRENSENAGSSSQNQSRNTSQSTKSSSSSRETKTKKSKSRTYVFEVKNGEMEDEDIVHQIEIQCVKVRHIISLTLDEHRGQILVTTTKKKRHIEGPMIEAIRKAGASARLKGQVGKKPKKHVVVREEEKTVVVEEEDETGYLDDEEYFGSERQGVLSRFGSTTLQQRLAEQRRKQQEAEQQKSSTAAIAAGVGNSVRAISSWFGY